MKSLGPVLLKILPTPKCHGLKIYNFWTHWVLLLKIILPSLKNSSTKIAILKQYTHFRIPKYKIINAVDITIYLSTRN